MSLISKIIRKKDDFSSKMGSSWRKFRLKLKYPSIKISGKTFIQKGCRIVCVDGGKMILKDVYINNGVHLFCGENAKIFISKTYIGMNSVIVANNKIEIKENCEIAEMVVIRDQNHKHDLSDSPIKIQGLESAPILIESNVWIGAKVTILKGVTVGANSIIGAHSLVNKSFKSQSKIAGIPAKSIQ